MALIIPHKDDYDPYSEQGMEDGRAAHKIVLCERYNLPPETGENQIAIKIIQEESRDKVWGLQKLIAAFESLSKNKE